MRARSLRARSTSIRCSESSCDRYAFPVRYGCRDRDPANRRRGGVARPGAGDGVDLNLTADGIVLQRAFGEAPNRVKSLSCIKNIYGLGLLFFSTSYAASGDGQGSEKRRKGTTWKISPRIARCILRTTAPYSSSLWSTSQRISATVVTARRRRLVQLLAQLAQALLQALFFTLQRREQARLDAGMLGLMVDDQQGLRQIEAVVRRRCRSQGGRSSKPATRS